jgi:hypothetical protein
MVEEARRIIYWTTISTDTSAGGGEKAGVRCRGVRVNGSKPTPKYHRHLPTRGRMLLSPDGPERAVAGKWRVCDVMSKRGWRLGRMADSHRNRGALNAERLRGRSGSPDLEVSVFPIHADAHPFCRH